MKKFMCSKGFLKIQIFYKALTERSALFCDSCLRFTAIFGKIVRFFFGRNVPNNTFLHVTNKEIKKAMWHRF